MPARSNWCADWAWTWRARPISSSISNRAGRRRRWRVTWKRDGAWTGFAERHSSAWARKCANASAEIRAGDVVLMDIWAKLDRPEGVYYDITWIGYCGPRPPEQAERVFGVLREARDRAVRRVKDAVAAKRELRGFEVDDAARSYIREQGFAE